LCGDAPCHAVYPGIPVNEDRYIVEVGLARPHGVFNAVPHEKNERAIRDLRKFRGGQLVEGHINSPAIARTNRAEILDFSAMQFHLAITNWPNAEFAALVEQHIVSRRLAEVLERNCDFRGLAKFANLLLLFVEKHDVGPQLKGDGSALTPQRSVSRLRPRFSVIGGELSEHGGSGSGGERKRANYSPKPSKEPGVIGGIARRISSLPLSAKVAGTIITALVAWLVMTIGFVRALKDRGHVIQGGGYILIGCALWFSSWLWLSGG
jgi:hypothetical protein